MLNFRTLRNANVIELTLLALVVVIFAVLQPIVDQRSAGMIMQGLVMLMLVVSLYVFSGTSGILSFGHSAIALVGGYTAAVLSTTTAQKLLTVPGLPGFVRDLQVGQFWATLAGGLASAVFGALVWAPLVRLSGIRGALASFAMLLVVINVASNWQSVTGGQTGLGGFNSSPNVWTLALWAIAVMLVASLYASSSSARRLRASREDEVAAQACGVNVPRARWIAAVVSSFIAGVGGALFTQYLGAYTPSMFSLNLDFLIVAMLLVGGLYSLRGAVLGAIALTVAAGLFGYVENGFSVGALHVGALPGLQQVAFAVITLAAVLLRPNGLVGDNLNITLGPIRRSPRSDVSPE